MEMTKTRSPNDLYSTPSWCVEQCLTYVLDEALHGAVFDTVLEPGAGRGVFVDALREEYGSDILIHALDIDRSLGPWKNADRSGRGDFLSRPPNHLFSPFMEERYDLVIGNPPYTYALEFIERSLELSDHVVFLLRLGFLSSAKRSAFFRDNPPCGVWVLSHRPSFTDDGQTDKYDYCFMAWRRGFRGKTRLHWLPQVSKEERRVA